jgi:tetratricopeptide (TPR) repeat protein
MRRATLGTLLTFALSAAALSQETRPAPDKAALAKAAEEAFSAQNWDEAAAQYRGLLKLDDKDGPAWHRLGYALHAGGKLDEALEAHLKAAEFPRVRSRGLYNAGCVHAMKKNNDQAFDYLMKAAAAGFNQSDAMAEDTDLAGLHADPRWEKLVAAVAAAKPTVAESIAFSQPGERKASRAVWFGGNGSFGQVAVSWGPIVWKTQYSEVAKSKKMENRRWRLGRDFWTTLDSNIPITIGDTAVPAGYYYLTLEKKSGGEFVLALLDPSAVKKTKLDAFLAHQSTGGIEVVLKHETVAEPASKLDLSVSVDQAEPTKGVFTIRFGPHKLSAPIAYQLAEK